MILIAIVDTDNGMLFNHRRQSQDRELRNRIADITAGGKLWMNHYSEKQFHDMDIPQVNVADNPLTEAGAGEFCFVEDLPVVPYEEWIEKIILYRWDKKYPSDLKLDIPLSAHGWHSVQTSEFPGYSHEKITEDIYIR